MSATLIYALHGFLGCAADWDALKTRLSEFEFFADELFSEKAELGADSIALNPGKKIFLGYSLGGRLGLRILEKSPEFFDHYVFLSTHPGLPDDNLVAREARKLSDQRWAEKITSDNWNSFLKEWNSQAVFTGSNQEPQRNLQNYDLTKLRKSLLNWSLSSQADYSGLIKKNRHKITWVVGDRDSKFCEIATDLKNKEILSGYERISSGHRIWLDQPDAVADIIKKLN